MEIIIIIINVKVEKRKTMKNLINFESNSLVVYRVVVEIVDWLIVVVGCILFGWSRLLPYDNDDDDVKIKQTENKWKKFHSN